MWSSLLRVFQKCTFFHNKKCNPVYIFTQPSYSQAKRRPRENLYIPWRVTIFVVIQFKRLFKSKAKEVLKLVEYDDEVITTPIWRLWSRLGLFTVFDPHLLLCPQFLYFRLLCKYCPSIFLLLFQTLRDDHISHIKECFFFGIFQFWTKFN